MTLDFLLESPGVDFFFRFFPRDVADFLLLREETEMVLLPERLCLGIFAFLFLFA